MSPSAGRDCAEEHPPDGEPEQDKNVEWMFNLYEVIQGMYSFFFPMRLF